MKRLLRDKERPLQIVAVGTIELLVPRAYQPLQYSLTSLCIWEFQLKTEKKATSDPFIVNSLFGYIYFIKERLV